MANARIIKRKDGVIQVQQRADERYDDTTLPRGTTPADVADQAIVDATLLDDVTDTQAQLDIVGGQVVKNVAAKPLVQQLLDRQAQAAAVFHDLAADSAVPDGVKRYLAALCDFLNIGPSELSHPQPPSTPPR